MGRGGRGRVATKAGVALAAGALPFALGMGTAAADEAYSQSFFADHTFTTGDGRSVTCSVSGESNLFRPSGSETYLGDALTEALGDDPACGRAFVEVLATYTDAGGRTKTTGANSIDGDVQWFADDVASGFSVVHQVTFNDCRADCEVSTTTSPK
jgi:hypothetical protein